MRRFTLWSVATTVVSGLLVLPLTTSADAAPTGSPPQDTDFEKVTLNDRPGEPMDLAVLPNGDVLHTTRAGKVWLNDADTGVNSVAAQFDVYQHDEEGLQSIALDPGYNGRTNKWVYVYYSPPMNTPVDDPATPDVNEGDAPSTARLPTSSPSRARSGSRATSTPAARSTCPPSSRSSTYRWTGVAAATSAATSSSTPRAT